MRAHSFIEGTMRLVSLDETACTADLEGIGSLSDPAGLKGSVFGADQLRRMSRLTLKTLMHIGCKASDNLDFLRPRHFRAARVLLDWTQEELARNASVVRRTIVMLESGGCHTQPRKMQAVLAALRAGGISFVCSDDGEVSLIDGNARLGATPVRRGAAREERLRTRISGRRPAVV